MGFLREAFSEDDNRGSASRLMMAFHAVIGAVCTMHVVFHNHVIPDAVTVAGITAFIVAPYAINKLHAAVTVFSPNEKV